MSKREIVRRAVTALRVIAFQLDRGTLASCKHDEQGRKWVDYPGGDPLAASQLSLLADELEDFDER